jgi:CMP-2-keto-3-deoxyoctulosonic acid synthetase
MTSTAILIPARYGSTRFPGKPLATLNNMPMIRVVYERCRKAGLDVYVLTDDKRIASKFSDSQVIVDDTDYANGTERCAGALNDKRLDKYTHFINVQGDMPDINARIIETVNYGLKYADVVTVHTEMDPGLKANPNTVKMVLGKNEALWFGRGFTYGEHHLGIYGYSREMLIQYPTLSITAEELIEQLEQLRWLKNGCKIGTHPVYFNGIEINSPEDVEAWHQKNSQ